MKKNKEIMINCKGSAEVTLQQIENYQGELKSISDKNRQKLKNSILNYGFIQPFAIWINKQGTKKILDGHQVL